MRAVLLHHAEGERVLGQPAGDAGGGAADGCRGVAAGDGAPLPRDHLAPVLHGVLLPAGSGPPHPHALLPGLLRLPRLQQVSPGHIHPLHPLPSCSRSHACSLGLFPGKLNFTKHSLNTSSFLPHPLPCFMNNELFTLFPPLPNTQYLPT